MAKKFDLKATALGRVTESSADEIMIGALTGKPSNDKVVVKLPLSLLDPYPLQEEAYPVQDGDYEAKAESMSKLGQLDPIHVVRAARGRYQILAGHRRVGGAKLLGWTEIDAIIDDVSPSIAEAIFHATNLDAQPENAGIYRYRTSPGERTTFQWHTDRYAAHHIGYFGAHRG